MKHLDVSGLNALQAYDYGRLQGTKHRIERGWNLSSLERDSVLLPLGLPYCSHTEITLEMCDEAIAMFVAQIVKERITK